MVLTSYCSGILYILKKGGEETMSDDKKGFAKMKEEGREEEIREIASKGGKSQGQENNPGNFANRPQEEVEEAARKGGSQ